MRVSRRKFITQSTLMVSSLEALAAFKVPAADGYALKVMATNWGFSGTITEFCKKAREAGYDGIEVWMPGDDKGRKEVMEAAAQNKLLVGFLYGGGDADYSKHQEQFKTGITEGLKLKPLYFNCHSGKDYYSFEQNKSLMDYSLDLGVQTGIPVYHETHRGRSLFAAHTTRHFMEKIPNLRLCFDVSHWCNVHESLLGDQKETLDMTLSRVDHIHARVGHAEGPQVSDPRAPEWDAAVKTHFAWWDQVVARKKKEGKIMTILTEFGPPDYLPTLPYTRQPVANQWDINVFMMGELRKRYA